MFRSANSASTLTARVVNEIRRDILLRVLKPKQKLLVNDLKERYGVGGSPIREALLQLSWFKYVAMEPQRGFWVSTLSINELTDILRIRYLLAKEIIPKSLAHGDEKWELEVLAAYHRLKRFNLHDPDVDFQLWSERRLAYHLAVISGKPSAVFCDQLLLLLHQLERYRYLWFNFGESNEQYENDLDEHEKILYAVQERDSDKILALIKQHDTRLLRLVEEKQVEWGIE